MHWFWLAFAAHGLGQIIFALQVKADHPDWRIAPIAVLALA